MRVSRHQAVLLEKELASPSLAHLVSLNGIHWHGFAKLITFQSLVTNNKPLCQTLIFCFLPDVMHLLHFIRFNPVWLLQSSKQCCRSWKLKVEECGKALSRRRDEDATWLKLLVWNSWTMCCHEEQPWWGRPFLLSETASSNSVKIHSQWTVRNPTEWAWCWVSYLMCLIFLNDFTL